MWFLLSVNLLPPLRTSQEYFIYPYLVFFLGLSVPQQEYRMSPIYGVQQNMERRTPDTYGRSKPVGQTRCPGDYEDIYADQMMYKRPISPLAYTNIKRTTPVVIPAQRTYTPVSMKGPSVQLRKPTSDIPRPHSADFLEYEVARQTERQQPRPKSSLDINRNTLNDNYFYSEECYAQNMRKSAQYLPKMPQYVPSEYVHQSRRQMPPEGDHTYPLMRSNTQPMRFENLQITDPIRKEPQPVRSRSVLSEGSLSKELELDVRESPQECYARASVSPAVMHCQGQYTCQDPRRRVGGECDQFMRSASARLAHYGQNAVPDGKMMGREGEKKVYGTECCHLLVDLNCSFYILEGRIYEAVVGVETEDAAVAIE